MSTAEIRETVRAKYGRPAAPEVDGGFMGAFVRARMPAAAGACCAPGCCG